MEQTCKEIYDLEIQLLKPETRNSPGKISELLSDDFFEFCSSGFVWHYNVNDVIDQADRNSLINWEIQDFSIKFLTMNVVLATYKSIRRNEESLNEKYSLRSSIWKLIDGNWKMVFHQGTPTNKT